MKKKYIIIIPVIIVLALFIYKSSVLLYFRDLNVYIYDSDNITYNEEKININKNLANTKYKDLNLYIPDEFSNASKEHDMINYYLKNESVDNYTTFIRVAKSSFCIEFNIKEDKRLQTMNYKKVMEKNDIENEFGLVKYYLNNEGVNYFSSTNQIKIYYLSKKCSQNIIGDNSSNYTFLNGDIDALRIKGKKITVFLIYNKNDDSYYSITIFKNTKNDNYYESLSKGDEDMIINSVYFN